VKVTTNVARFRNSPKPRNHRRAVSCESARYVHPVCASAEDKDAQDDVNGDGEAGTGEGDVSGVAEGSGEGSDDNDGDGSTPGGPSGSRDATGDGSSVATGDASTETTGDGSGDP